MGLNWFNYATGHDNIYRRSVCTRIERITTSRRDIGRYLVNSPIQHFHVRVDQRGEDAVCYYKGCADASRTA